MKRGAPTITWLSSDIRLVSGSERFVAPGLVDRCGRSAVSGVALLEKHGDLATLTLEHWKTIAPNIWLATSQKR